MDISAPKPDDAVEPPEALERGGSVKFLYPTGARPLEGYTIKRGIGRGGFGEVYFATSDAGKEVALKLVRRNLDVELRGVTHCLNLKHSNLISVYDIRTDSVGDQWVVMEYVSGESLEDALERNPNGLPPEEALRWMHGIGAGVAYLHDHGIVHRDLKPGNVFLDDDDGEFGVVKIGDYGLSKFISCSRRSGQTESVGTVHYMAPEIANGRYGREIDTYALGIMLYEMLTGHVPFDGESVGEVLMKHLTAEPDLDTLEEPYREIVRRTLAKDPELRIGSVSEMISMLPDGESVGPLRPRKIDGWTNAHAASDGIGAAHTFIDTSVRGMPATSVRPTPANKEPLYDWVSTSWSGIVDRWHNWPLNPVAKSLLLFAIVAVVVFNVPEWGPVAAGAAFVYVFYYIFWALFVKRVEPAPVRGKARRTNPDARTAAHANDLEVSENPPQTAPRQRGRAAHRRRRRVDWRAKVNKELAGKSIRTKSTELLTAMVFAGVLCTFLSLMAALAVGGHLGTERVPLHLWISIVSTASCWVILATNKFCEGRFEDQIPLRMAQMVGGAVVGLLAWGVSNALLIGVPSAHDVGLSPHDSLYQELFQMDTSEIVARESSNAVVPNVLVSMAYFSFMLLLMRWWRLAEYTRRVRLSLVGVGLCICGAWIAHLVCWYPQPTGMAVAGVVAIATQLVSPWLPPSGRKELVEDNLAAEGMYS